jgi:hypothetical protein
MMKDKYKKYPSEAVKLQVFKRDKFTCVYCGITGAEAELQCDHVHPISKGGSNHMSNLRASCRKCNQAKGDKLDFKYSNMTSTKQENTYYFRYEKEWYKTESNLKDETLIVTGIDPLKYEYKTKLLKIEDKSNIYFYADFEELLIDYDTETWDNDIINGSLLDHHERNFYQMRYLTMLNPDDVFCKKVSEDKELSKFMLKQTNKDYEIRKNKNTEQSL